MTTPRPVYQLFDALSEDEYAALRDDIAARGVLVPIELDEDGNILDGHHRARACAELGIADYPRVVRAGLSEQEKRDHTRSLQMLRRHLTSEQKRQVIADQVRETPDRSDRVIGRMLGVDHKTVGAVRAGTRTGGEIPQMTRDEPESPYREATRQAAALLQTVETEFWQLAEYHAAGGDTAGLPPWAQSFSTLWGGCWRVYGALAPESRPDHVEALLAVAGLLGWPPVAAAEAAEPISFLRAYQFVSATTGDGEREAQP